MNRSTRIATLAVTLSIAIAWIAGASAEPQSRGRRSGRAVRPVQARGGSGRSIAVAGTSISGSTGADGEFMPTVDTVIDLADADTGMGKGTYDSANWRVVFNYTTVKIPSNVTVSFENHPSRAPVVWLATHDVTIHGTVLLNGEDGIVAGGTGNAYAEPGPGGFRGGSWSLSGVEASPGFGFGGAEKNLTSSASGTGGSYESIGEIASFNGGAPGPTYGSPSGRPLIGGSGGAPFSTQSGINPANGGGAGGGAILIATDKTFEVASPGLVQARGGNGYSDNLFANDGGGGSGGLIRVVADTIKIKGQLDARGGFKGANDGGNGGDGRIRLEAKLIEVTGGISPMASSPLGHVRLAWVRGVVPGGASSSGRGSGRAQ